MSWAVDTALQVCVALSLCADAAPIPIALPDDDKGVWDFEVPAPVPVPVVPTPTTIILNPPPAAIAPITLQAPPEPREPPRKPKPDPALAASKEILKLRRLAALENGLKPFEATLTIDESEESPSGLGLLGGLPSKPRPLDFNSLKRQQERYDAPGVDSGLPVDNTRIITEDEPIPVVLENAINSQRPGKVILVVERDIFGSHGSLILIPKFSRIVCNFDEPDHANSTKIGMSCNRILSADKRFEIFGLNAEAGNPQGGSGVTGGVDKRFWEKYGTAFILTGISTATRIATGLIKTTNENQNIVSAAKTGAEELSQKFGEITAKVLEETVSLKPVIRISQGTRMSITLGSDWYLRKTDSGIN